MNREIWKFELSPRVTLNIPKGGKVLAAKKQLDSLYIWVLVDPSATPVERFFEVYGTGHPIPDSASLEFINAAIMEGGALVFHVFERTAKLTQ
jgi:hypothetical protein